MVDDFAGYKALFTHGVIELDCLAHARRKFFDLHAANANPMALEALNRIAALYAIEKQGKDLDVAARTQLRKDEALPLLQSMHDWLLRMRGTVANGGESAGPSHSDNISIQGARFGLCFGNSFTIIGLCIVVPGFKTAV